MAEEVGQVISYDAHPLDLESCCMDMNGDNTAEAAYAQSHCAAERSVLSGNASLDGTPHRGWFIGHFLGGACGLRATSAVEVKWSSYRAGEERPLWGVSECATTLCIL